ncbi:MULTISPECIES: acyl-CoA dehydrogenase family protein [Rhodomicrobium]|uniref:acyl-CoA dehydrogenase family protein n=1 Tax=Rhodomicrobium TaxID=1068 RepID=UPI001481FBC9|nr:MULTISPECIES: acyl-CoA dehydrogenase family protein [Rhodomicrobium]
MVDPNPPSVFRSHPDIDETVIARASAFVPELRERSQEIHALGRIPADLFERIDAAGLVKLSAPRSHGGFEADMKTRHATLVELGRGDLSVGWILALMNNASWALHALYPKAVADALVATPGGFRAGATGSPSAKVRKAAGGYMIEEGQWGFNSGIYHASWDALAIPLVDEAGTVIDHGFAFVPVEAITILNDWDTAGLRGTGSSSIRVRDVFVPEERVAPLSKILSGEIQGAIATAPVFRASVLPLLSVTEFSPVLGAAQTALDILLERLPGRTVHGSNEMKSESPVIHLQIGEISAKIDAANLLIQRAADDIDRNAQAGTEQMQLLDRARIRRDIGFAARLVAEAVDNAAVIYGASAAAVSNPMGRVWRDIRTATLHGLLAAPPSLEIYGRLRCGQPPKQAMY